MCPGSRDTGFSREPRLRHMPLLLALSICCFSAAAIIRCVDPLVPDIARGFATSPNHIALLASAFAVPYALGQPLLGPLGDAVGKSRIIKGCLAILTVAMMLSALAPTPDTLFAARIMAGLAAGGTVPVSLAMVGDRFSIAERQVALSRLLAAMLTGQLAGGAGAGLIGDAYGWRAVMWIGAALILSATILAHMTLAPRPAAERKSFNLASIRSGYAKVFENPRAKICYGAVFIGGVCLFGVLPHVATLLEQRHVGSVREAGFVNAGIAVGGVIYAVTVRAILRALGGQLNMIRAGGFITGMGFVRVVSLKLAPDGCERAHTRHRFLHDPQFASNPGNRACTHRTWPSRFASRVLLFPGTGGRTATVRPWLCRARPSRDIPDGRRRHVRIGIDTRKVVDGHSSR